MNKHAEELLRYENGVCTCSCMMSDALKEAAAEIERLEASFSGAITTAGNLSDKVAQLEAELNAWKMSFGSQQLTHALARLELAEKERDEALNGINMALDAQEATRILKFRIDELSNERDKYRQALERIALHGKGFQADIAKEALK